MRRIAVTAGIVLALAPFLIPVLQQVRAQASCDAPDASLDTEELAFLALINEYRATSGAPPLAVSPALNRAAAWIAADMGAKGYLGHTDSLGRSPWTRMTDCGYSAPAGENLAGGTNRNAGAQAFAMFRSSPPHDDNMRYKGFREIGIARAFVPGSPLGWYWATEFGNGLAAPSATLTPAATPTPIAPAPRPVAPVQAASAPPPPPPPPPAAAEPAPRRIQLVKGFNLVAWPLDDAPPAAVAARAGGPIVVVMGFDHAIGRYRIYSPLLPGWMNTLKKVLHGESYWMAAGSGAALTLE